MRLRFGSNRHEHTVVCDDKHDYKQAARHPSLQGRIRLVVVPNVERGPKGSPRSAAATSRDREMFANDLLQALIRHSLAHHHRETIAFPRRANAAIERLFLMAIWRNFVKGVSERKPDPTTPAMRKGLVPSPWTWERVFARRLFPDRLQVPTPWMDLYRRNWFTPSLPSNSTHSLRLAF